jgi:glycosyltransferase involved in cell wall biosynthesis
MRRIAFLSPVFPLPLDRGQNVRIFNLLKACAANFDVTLIVPRPGATQSPVRVEQLCERVVYVDYLSRPSLSLLFRYTLTMRFLPRRTLHSFSIALAGVDLSDFLFIWVERSFLATLCRKYSAKTIVDLDDIEYMGRLRQMKLEPRYPKMLYGIPSLVWVWLREVLGSRKYGACVVCSDEDRKRLIRLGLKNVVTIPNGIDIPTRVSRRPTMGHAVKNRLVFLGNMSYNPNADAVKFFAHQVLPVVAERLSSVTFDVIGPNVDRSLLEIVGSHVQFRGFVEDLPSTLSEYDIFVAPLRYGSGTKLKVLAAMASRLPIVTTTVGADGLGLLHDLNALVADSAQQLAECIVALARDPVRAERLAARAFDDVQEHFEWTAIRERMGNWLQEFARQQED